MKTFTLFTLTAVLMMSSACNLNDPEDTSGIRLTEKAAQLVDAGNQFGFDLFQKTYANETDANNIMVSPVSVALALAMTYNGAETSTKEAMEKALRLQGLSRQEINESYQALIKGLQSIDPKVILEIANAIYYRQGFEVEPNFVNLNQKFYDAEISALDFSSPSAVQTINDWVNGKTHGKIPTILDQITPMQVMFLLNAIYFKGTWAKEFNPKSTEEQPFYVQPGQPVQTKMMHRLDTLDYATTEDFSAIRLPYGKGNYNMYVFLPSEGKTPGDIVTKLNKQSWNDWMKSFRLTQTVDIMLPKFKYPYEIMLNDVLTDMGMGIAFTGAADFSGINRFGDLLIDYVKHKTFIDVNEEGTEAAAVTIVAIERTSVGPTKTYFHVNKPFMYAITEKSTGAVMFIGTVKHPVYE